jgi:hypothetical protein
MYFRASMPHAGPMALELLHAQYAMMGASEPGSPGHIFSTTTLPKFPGLHEKLCRQHVQPVHYPKSVAHVYSFLLTDERPDEADEALRQVEEGEVVESLLLGTVL